ncbi:MAG: pentapeptide repeat-containing protein [Verrucomicrobia bacterium]|nr:pentapeptide repeat-containing protein [Verrucomicrobiota bacterium]
MFAFARLSGFVISGGVSENSNLDDRVAALEKAAAAKPRSSSRWLWLLFGAALALLLLSNLWLARQSLNSARRADYEHYFWVVCHKEFPAGDRVEAFLALAAIGNKEWRSAHLYGLNLQSAVLPDTDLAEADFNCSNFTRATLAGARLTHARLQQADFTGADLSRTDLSGAQLYKATLKGAKLLRANLRGAILQEAEAQDANLLAADLSDAFLLMANLTGANLTGVNLSGATLEAAMLRGANLSLARLSGTDLKDADFTGANWWRAQGLTTEQLAWLKKKFPPDEAAEPAQRADFENWLKTAGAGK